MTLDHEVVSCGKYLIIQLKRFINNEGNLIKDIQEVHCNPTISLPVASGEVTLNRKFKLIATINHSGNLNRGHYTSFIKKANSTDWYFCNDAAVILHEKFNWISKSCYICFYEAM